MKNDYDISGVVIHPDFKITVSYNDIAILRLRERAHFSMHIKPICLPETDEETFERQSAKVIGWGAEEFGEFENWEMKRFKTKKCQK